MMLGEVGVSTLAKSSTNSPNNIKRREKEGGGNECSPALHNWSVGKGAQTPTSILTEPAILQKGYLGTIIRGWAY